MNKDYLPKGGMMDKFKSNKDVIEWALSNEFNHIAEAFKNKKGYLDILYNLRSCRNEKEALSMARIYEDILSGYIKDFWD